MSLMPEKHFTRLKAENKPGINSNKKKRSNYDTKF